MKRRFWRFSMVALLIAIPVTLALVLRERQSWRPRVIPTGARLNGLCISSDGSKVAAVGADSFPDNVVGNNPMMGRRVGFQVRGLPNGQLILRSGLSSPIAVSFSLDGNELLESYNMSQIRFWNLSTKRAKAVEFDKLQLLRERAVWYGYFGDFISLRRYLSVLSYQYPPPIEWNGGRGVVPALTGPELLLFDAITAKLLVRLRLDCGPTGKNYSRSVEQVTMTADGRNIAGVVGLTHIKPKPTGWVITSWRRELWVWDHSGRVRFVSNAPELAELSSLKFSPRGDRLATLCLTSSDGFRVRMWSLDGKLRVRTAKEPDSSANGSTAPLRFSPDGQSIAYGLGHHVRIRNASTGKLIRELAHPADVNSLAFTPDGKTLVTTCDDKNLRLWRLK